MRNQKRSKYKLLLWIALAILPTLLVAKAANTVTVVSFGDYQSGSIDEWLQRKGFRLERDARRRNIVDLDVGDDGLTVEAKRRALGLMPNESVNVTEFTQVKIKWGINKFPEGASYEKGVRNEALMVIFFLGDERQKSGSLLIPDSPYFVALFLCHGDDRVNHPYVGAYFKQSGRYVCVDRPAPGKMVTSRFDLLEAYREYFDKERDDDPAVSGIALALDTQKATGSGQASAFIREIRFLQ